MAHLQRPLPFLLCPGLVRLSFVLQWSLLLRQCFFRREEESGRRSRMLTMSGGHFPQYGRSGCSSFLWFFSPSLCVWPSRLPLPSWRAYFPGSKLLLHSIRLSFFVPGTGLPLTGLALGSLCPTRRGLTVRLRLQATRERTCSHGTCTHTSLSSSRRLQIVAGRRCLIPP